MATTSSTRHRAPIKSQGTSHKSQGTKGVSRRCYESTNRDAARQELGGLRQFIVIAARSGLAKRSGGFHLSGHQKPDLVDAWTVGVCVDGIRRNRVRPVVEVLEPDAAADCNNNAWWLETSCCDIHNRLGAGGVWPHRWSVAAAATARREQQNQEDGRPLPHHDAEMIAGGRRGRRARRSRYLTKNALSSTRRRDVESSIAPAPSCSPSTARTLCSRGSRY